MADLEARIRRVEEQGVIRGLLNGGLLKVPSRTELPTAGENMAYRQVVVQGTPDTLYICLRATSGAWGWVQQVDGDD